MAHFTHTEKNYLPKIEHFPRNYTPSACTFAR